MMWLTKANLLIYCSHFLSCWGNRMWTFGIGMFLVRIAGDRIQLSAVYGLASGVAVFLLGALVGDWVDKTPRLKAAQLSLVLQDALMLASAAVITTFFWNQQHIRTTSTWLSPLLKATIVSLGVLSNLASQARLLAVERDWIVEICGRNSDHLASMTAMLRRIDQICMILAPVATGQVMTYIGLIGGAVFIGTWNLLSVFVEFFLMWKVYNTVPALKALKNARRTLDTSSLNLKHSPPQLPTSESIACLTATVTQIKDDANLDSQQCHYLARAEGGEQQPISTVETELHHLPRDSAGVDLGENCEEQARDAERISAAWAARASRSHVLYQFVTLYRGWRAYITFQVALAGLALAFLYMTVLSFDTITVAYAVTQGLTESVLGILMGSSAVFGIVGTFAYPVIRRHAGLVRTGFIALSCQLSCLTLCVASIWLPGSPFDPYFRRIKVDSGNCGVGSTSDQFMSQVSADFGMTAATGEAVGSVSESLALVSSSTDSSSNCGEPASHAPDSYISIIFLMAGIFLARFGLWIADLTITQLFLEKLAATERGIVNGVQSSLNQLLDLLKFALVVALPNAETYGFLIIVSFSAIATAWVLYAVFVHRERVSFCVCGQASDARETRNTCRTELNTGPG